MLFLGQLWHSTVIQIEAYVISPACLSFPVKNVRAKVAKTRDHAPQASAFVVHVSTFLITFFCHHRMHFERFFMHPLTVMNGFPLMDWLIFISVALSCGKSSSDNNTYLVQTSVTALTSPCTYTICPCNKNICRTRFDFAVSFFLSLYL